VQFSELQKLRELDSVTLTLDRVEVTLLRISGQCLPTHQKLFVDVRTDVQTDRHPTSVILLAYRLAMT